ncbi:hypothetical protein OK016_12355 [Vibrio chagasii]|nr:hypothetical protein [Vibrio chagasii]
MPAPRSLVQNRGEGVNHCIAIGTGSAAIQLDNQYVTHQFGGWGFRLAIKARGEALVLKRFSKHSVEFDVLNVAR